MRAVNGCGWDSLVEALAAKEFWAEIDIFLAS